jgi:hypothetical protein
MLRIFTPIARDQQIAAIRNLDHAGTLNNDYLLPIVLSCIIATLGLVLDSAAVIIGVLLNRSADVADTTLRARHSATEDVDVGVHECVFTHPYFVLPALRIRRNAVHAARKRGQH